MHLDDVGRGSNAVLHHQPGRVFPQIAALVLDRIRVLQLAQEPSLQGDRWRLSITERSFNLQLSHSPDLLEDVVPLLETLLAQVAHLLDGHYLPGQVAARVVHGAEAAVPDFTQVIEDLLGVVLVEQVRNLGVLERAGPRRRHLGVCRSSAPGLAHRPRVRTLRE